MSNELTIAIAGAGNVAFHLGKALVDADVHVHRIYNRTPAKATELAALLGSTPVSELSELEGCDLIICCVSDAALELLIPQLSERAPVVTTSGTTDVLSFAHHHSVGVLYPLQSFSKDNTADFRQIPLFIEASDPELEAQLLELGKRISETVHVLPAAKRTELHLAAVFINNFTNHLVDKGQQYMQQHNLPVEWLMPLLRQTVGKLDTQSAYDAQTGPARRGDQVTIDRHLAMLPTEDAAIYRLLSESIKQRYFPHD